MLALAASASAGTAAAGTGVELYGVIDMALVHESGGQAALTKLTSGVESGSRFGLRGREDLGGGRAAVFVLESGFRADTGQAGQGGRLFGRQAYVGLESRLGTVTLGLQLTPQYLAMAAADPFDTGMAGDTENLMGFAGTMESSVKYASPRWHGVNVELAYASGDKSGQQRGGHAAGGAFSYTSGPLAVHVGHHRRSNPAAPAPEPDQEPASNTLLAAVYDFGVAKTHIAVGRDKVRTARRCATVPIPSAMLSRQGQATTAAASCWACPFPRAQAYGWLPGCESTTTPSAARMLRSWRLATGITCRAAPMCMQPTAI